MKNDIKVAVDNTMKCNRCGLEFKAGDEVDWVVNFNGPNGGEVGLVCKQTESRQLGCMMRENDQGENDHAEKK